MRLHGVDLSHHQHPGALPWELIAKTSQFVVARASNGTMRDRHCVEHAKRVRDRGLKLGLYHFFQHDQPAMAQAAVFLEVAEQVGLTAGDIVPMLDLEDDTADRPTSMLSPAWSEPARLVSNSFARAFGDAGTYITQADWRRLGQPAWVLARPLWVAHWGVTAPATPGARAWAVWQYRVGPYNPGAQHVSGEERRPEALDHNWALHPLPLIGAAPKTEPPTPPPTPTLKRGDSSFHVEELQRLLNRVACPRPPLRDDGMFGVVTEHAVKSFQRARGLSPDGIVGALTWRELRRDTEPSPPSTTTGSKR